MARDEPSFVRITSLVDYLCSALLDLLRAAATLLPTSNTYAKYSMMKNKLPLMY